MSKKVKIPKDVIRSGHSDKDCYARFYGATKEEVEKKEDAYFQNYPPQGYGTYCKGIFQHPNGYWFCHITRYHSCD